MFDFFNILFFSWYDLVDIAILSFIIYNVILLIQGTRSTQILLGFILLISLFYTAELLGLESILWLFKNIFQYIVIIIIIIFQTDIRNALANFGRARIFKRKKNISYIDIIRIVRTAEIMQQTKKGIILAFEKRIGLKEYLKTGVIIDGVISSPLLLSIFNTKSPLHDGAVIIDSNFRIAASSCILPLASRIDLKARYGTRHRAAIGLSEITDSVVLVVSEETGKISLFLEGQIEEDVQIVNLEKLLIKYLIGNEER